MRQVLEMELLKGLMHPHWIDGTTDHIWASTDSAQPIVVTQSFPILQWILIWLLGGPGWRWSRCCKPVFGSIDSRPSYLDTQDCLQKIQSRYSGLFEPWLESDVWIDPPTWWAFFLLFHISMACLLCTRAPGQSCLARHPIMQPSRIPDMTA